jgi:membrane-bound lytic murein transglycosylase D
MPDVPVRWSPRVLQYLDFYKSDPRGRAIAAIWYRKSGGFEPMLREVMRRHGLPSDLMWVAVVESGLRPTAYSPVGAAGLWQFMPESGRLYGLVVDRWVDERLDPVRSTHAAAMYLEDLHRRFGTWELALAAYNMGFGGLLTAVRKYNTNDFWELSRYEAGIPWETTLYVPKILALMVVAKNPEVFGLGNQQRDPPAEFDEIDVVPGVSLEAVAKAAGVDLADIEQLNPQLLASRVPPRSPSRAAAGVWRIRVPKGRAAKVNENLVKTRASEVRLQPHIVRYGESLADVARAYGVSEARIARDNALRPDEVPRPGTALLVPLGPEGKTNSAADRVVVVVPLDLRAPPAHRRVFYQVVAGDTLEGVAEAFSVPPDELRRWNGLDSRARLQAGMSMMVIVPNAQDISGIRTLAEDGVRVLVVGTDAFFNYYEGLKGRVRTTTVVRAGEDWRGVARRTGLSVGMLERINRRSRRTALQHGETLVVYLPASQVPQPAVRADEPDDAGRATPDTDEPDDTTKQEVPAPAAVDPPAAPSIDPTPP